MHRPAAVLLCTFALLVTGVLAGAPCHAQEELCIPMEGLLIAPPEGAEQKRAAVEFSHARHFSYACRQCHHTWEGAAQMAGCGTSGCHDQLATPRDPETGLPDPAQAVRYYKKAYHQLCIGCHKEIKQRNRALEMSREKLDGPLSKTGPTGCVKCHPKDD